MGSFHINGVYIVVSFLSQVISILALFQPH